MIEFKADPNATNTIPVSDIRGIFEDSENTIHIATFGKGLLRWSDSKNQFEQVQIGDQSDDQYLTLSFRSRDGDIFLGSKEQLIPFYGKREPFRESSSFRAQIQQIGRPYDIEEHISGDLLIAGDNGLFRLSLASREIHRIFPNDSIESEHLGIVTTVELGPRESVFIGTNKGLILLWDLKESKLLSKLSLGERSAESITQLLWREEFLWIGSNNGLYISDLLLSDAKNLNQDNSGLSSNHVTVLLSDTNYIWIGTYQGLDILSKLSFETFNKENSDVFDDVLAFEEDNSGRLWVGTYDGIYYFDTELNRHRKLENVWNEISIEDQRIMTLAAKKGELWVGTQEGGVRIIDLVGRFVYAPEPPLSESQAVTKILHAGNNRTWIATYDRGLFSVSEKGVRSYYSSEHLLEKAVTVIARGNKDQLIIGTETAIYLYNEKTDQFQLLDFDFQGHTDSPVIMTIKKSPTGDIWVGTKDHGLFIWKISDQKQGNLTLKHVRNIIGSNHLTIYAIEFDYEKNAWCSTQFGLIRIDSNGNFLTRFTPSDGLQGDDFNFGASLVDNEGRLYFGGVKGYNRFLPEHVAVEDSPSDIVLTEVALPSKIRSSLMRTPDLTHVQLTHKDYFVKFTFSVLDFLDPDKNHYRYKLEGFDPEWIDNGTRNTATYTNLPAGNYVLKVQGANSAGTWNREGLALNVEVLPAWWLTWWAFTFYAGSLAFVVWLLMRWYHTYMVKESALEDARTMEEVALGSEDDLQEQYELQDRLLQSVFHHNTATLKLVNDCVASESHRIHDDIYREAFDKNIRRVNALAVLEDCMFYQGDTILADLRKYADRIIAVLLTDSPIRAETVTTINDISSRLLPVALASPLAIILFELVENALHHAFEQGSPVNYVHLVSKTERLDTDDPMEFYNLNIQDSGLGIPGNIDLSALETSGLAIVQSLVNQLSGKLQIFAEGGTTVSVVIPIPRA
ncbi:MAG: triple tyrosine motif-containing protein [Halioglobus sp.]